MDGGTVNPEWEYKVKNVCVGGWGGKHNEILRHILRFMKRRTKVESLAWGRVEVVFLIITLLKHRFEEYGNSQPVPQRDVTIIHIRDHFHFLYLVKCIQIFCM